MAAELDDLFASPEDCGLSRTESHPLTAAAQIQNLGHRPLEFYRKVGSRSSVCSRTRTGSENRTTTSQQPTLPPSPCDRVAAKRSSFLRSVPRNADRTSNPLEAHSAMTSGVPAPSVIARRTDGGGRQRRGSTRLCPLLGPECDDGTSDITLLVPAPSATRMPISAVRCDTEYATIP